MQTYQYFTHLLLLAALWNAAVRLLLFVRLSVCLSVPFLPKSAEQKLVEKMILDELLPTRV